MSVRERTGLNISGHKSDKVSESNIRVGKAGNARRIADMILAAKKNKKAQGDK